MTQTKTELDVMHYLYDVIEEGNQAQAQGLSWQPPQPYLEVVLNQPCRDGFWNRWELFVLGRSSRG